LLNPEDLADKVGLQLVNASFALEGHVSICAKRFPTNRTRFLIFDHDAKIRGRK
jgi:hypothetical protein